MELIKLINDTPVNYSVAAFRGANPHTIYGNSISNASLNEQDVYRVRTLPEPTVNIGQKAVKSTTATQMIQVNGYMNGQSYLSQQTKQENYATNS
jgi:hypothetical protein